MLLSASESAVDQFLRHLKLTMMRNNRKQIESSSSEDEDSSDSDSDPVFQVGFLKISYQKQDLVKETIARFSQSLLDLSISPTNIYFLGSTKFISEDTPYDKFNLKLAKQCESFFQTDILPNRNLYANIRYLLTEVRDITINQTFRKIEKQITEYAITIVKDKIKAIHEETIRQAGRANRSNYIYRPEDPCLFAGALGKYIKDKKIGSAI